MVSRLDGASGGEAQGISETTHQRPLIINLLTKGAWQRCQAEGGKKVTINLSRLDEDIPRVFAVFAGMDKEYVALIRKHHAAVLDADLTMQAKNKSAEATKEAVKELKRKYFEKAMAVLDTIREEYRPKVEPKKYSTEERLLNVTLWSQPLPTSTADELRSLYLEHKGNPDFDQLLEAEIRRRETKNPNDMALRSLRHQIEAEPQDQAFAELKKIETGLAFLASMDHYPAKLESLSHHEIRNVDADLAAYPILDGPTFRPVFDIR